MLGVPLILTRDTTCKNKNSPNTEVPSFLSICVQIVKTYNTIVPKKYVLYFSLLVYLTIVFNGVNILKPNFFQNGGRKTGLLKSCL